MLLLVGFIPAAGDRLLEASIVTKTNSGVMVCGSATPSHQLQPQVRLRQPCPGLVVPEDGIIATALRWTVEAIRMYRECQSRQARLVGAWPK